MTELRQLFAPLTTPAKCWLRRQYLMHCIRKWQNDIAVIERQRINDRAVEKIRQTDIAHALSEVRRLYL